MKKWIHSLSIVLLLISTNVLAQAPVQIRLQSIHIDSMPGLQSFAAGTYQNKWILVGGRTDGLHMKQPFASFHPDYNNTQIVVVDPAKQKVYKASVLFLPAALAEQLQSSNMEAVQRGDLLYLFGGYGYSASQKKFITHPRITVLQLPEIMKAIEQQQPIHSFIQTLEDERMAVTGGGAGWLNDKFYLVGGQKFTGRYNPHGPDHGPGFVQEYTNEIRQFSIGLSGNQLVIKDYKATKDEAELHRRDYNLVPQIFPDGKAGFTVFAGVFQYKEDVPWLHPVDIWEAGYQPNKQFEQQFNHYHSAHVPIYSKEQNLMHTVFFGGIARYYRQNDETKEDKEIPFVKTISQVTRMGNGSLAEQALPVEMPGWLGASAWFGLNEELPQLQGQIINWDALPAGEHLAGYVIGGINSSAPNIFWPNTGKESTASASVIAVYIRK